MESKTTMVEMHPHNFITIKEFMDAFQYVKDVLYAVSRSYGDEKYSLFNIDDYSISTDFSTIRVNTDIVIVENAPLNDGPKEIIIKGYVQLNIIDMEDINILDNVYAKLFFGISGSNVDIELDNPIDSEQTMRMYMEQYAAKLMNEIRNHPEVKEKFQ